MNKHQLGKLYPVTLTRYNSDWPILFEKEKAILLDILGHDLKIEHIGSTAVPGLSAKPVIDILLEKPASMSDEQVIQKMTVHGYIHMEEQTRHLMFVKGYGPSGLEKESYHVHIGPLDQNWLWDRVYFRNYLRENNSEAIVYEKLKMKLAQKYPNDREAYTEGKSDYIRRITGKAKIIE